MREHGIPMAKKGECVGVTAKDPAIRQVIQEEYRRSLREPKDVKGFITNMKAIGDAYED